MRAYNTIGDGPLSDPVTFRAASVPDAPLAPTKNSSTTSSITIDWNEPGYNGGNAITDYSIYIDDGLGGTLQYLASTGDPTVRTY